MDRSARELVARVSGSVTSRSNYELAVLSPNNMSYLHRDPNWTKASNNQSAWARIQVLYKSMEAAY